MLMIVQEVRVHHSQSDKYFVFDTKSHVYNTIPITYLLFRCSV